MKIKTALLTTALGACAVIAFSQDAGGPRPPGGGPGEPGPRGARPGPAIMAALDANKDGKLDATEIANASAALKTLDKNNDGEVSGQEMMGPRPDGDRPGGPRGERAPGGPRGERPAPPAQK